MVIIAAIIQVVHKGTNYLNKTLSVCQYNLAYSGYIHLIIETVQGNLWDLKGENNINRYASYSQI